jgi:hypothetical protein
MVSSKVAQIAQLQKKHGVNIRYQRGGNPNGTNNNSNTEVSQNASRLSNSVSKGGGS